VTEQRPKPMSGRVAFVTGAGSGIGRETARMLAARGATVIASDIDLPAAQETVEGSPNAYAVLADVSSLASIDAAVADSAERFGGLDIVINNAGINLIGSVESMPEEVYDRGMAVNLKGVFLVSKAAWPYLVKAGRGAIVNVSSVGGLWAIPNNPVYCATKAGIILMSKSMALDGAQYGIRVNVVCPGFILTPMSQAFYDAQPDPVKAREEAASDAPVGRLGTPEDVARAICYLASDDAEFVTGTAHVVDGALTAGFWKP
jgi:NAD(P)-dependent dehydrogenase (short-subunit alcohol dehydrogenase family)